MDLTNSIIIGNAVYKFEKGRGRSSSPCLECALKDRCDSIDGLDLCSIMDTEWGHFVNKGSLKDIQRDCIYYHDDKVFNHDDIIDTQIGESFLFEDEDGNRTRIMAVDINDGHRGCVDCFFSSCAYDCDNKNCLSEYRHDKKMVIYKKA